MIVLGETDSNNFRAINPDDYFDQSQARMATKTTTIQARPAVAGEEVITVMKDGHVETRNTAKAGDYIVTNPDGERYIVPGEKFESKYAPTETPGVYRPAGGPVKVMTLQEDVSFKAPWGEEMRIRADGVLVYNGLGDVYGIQPDEFRRTYAFVDVDPARDVARSASHADDVLNKIGRLGAVGGLVVGAYLALEGDLEAAAAVVIPGAETTMALADGDFDHAVTATVDEFTFGAASLIASIEFKPIELDDDERAFFDIYDRLPSQATDNMPPEVASLAVFKTLIVDAESRIAAQVGAVGFDAASARQAAQSDLDHVQQLYQQQFDELQSDGGLDVVVSYLNVRPADLDHPHDPAACTEAEPEGTTLYPLDVRIPSP
ncbi:MAG: hypothetical protein AB7P52_05180 [Alphaproteobacteria bacterium]